ncbi:S1C family serine protease [Paenibacillus sp. YYML68]|uniref:S1C family serine protease n=1 Tax=Paenibacillus sp. YYML68 TaxID=2909250 RepID=UPI002491062F|nr:trypsin-like peptidase domain-containing protein [Paenibacillus sp. YYML68]
MKMLNRISKKAAQATAIVLLASTLSVPAVYAASAEEQRRVIPDVVAKTTSSVVAIIGKPSGNVKLWEASRYNLAHGTGVIVRSEGYILTNAHVVKDMNNITVVTSDGKSYSGKTTHYDEESDLALVKIEATGLAAATFAKASDIKVGEPVMAIGTPLSFTLRNSVTYGIVSGMERSVQSKYQLIQTDAAINPGNSGGALVNMSGEVIGINTLKFVEFGVDSLGFAIPVDTVQHVLDHFFKYGKVKRPYIGTELGESWEAVVGIPSAKGLEVTYVEPESPAALAGVKQGDVLLSIDSQPTTTLVQYNEALKKFLPEQRVKLTLQSGGAQKTVELVLGEDESGVTSLAQAEDGSYIDDDQGKTQIGDSYYGWSMKYPAGLIKVAQDEQGNKVAFADAKGEFAIKIEVQEKQTPNMSPLGLLRRLTDSSYVSTVLEKQVVNGQPATYAKLVGQGGHGEEYYQTRLYQKGDKLYFVTLAVLSEDLYQNSFKLNSYNDLLDSFVMEHDADNKQLKDISVYQSRKTVETEYGLVFDAPDQWTEDKWGEELSYESEDGEQSLTVRITSAASGDTLQAWAEREQKQFTDTYAPAYRKVKGIVKSEIADSSALENRYSYSMGDKWQHVHTLYILKDKYKYELALTYSEDADEQEVDQALGELRDSIRFPKEAYNRSLGYIQDEDDLLDANRTLTYTNTKYRYAIKTPEAWFDYEDDDTDTYMKLFSFEGGSLTIAADDQIGLQEEINSVEKSYKKNAEADAEYKYTKTEEQLFGTKVTKLVTHYKSRNVPYTQNDYVFEKNGVVYSVTIEINDAVRTEERWKQLQDALASMTFTDKS